MIPLRSTSLLVALLVAGLTAETHLSGDISRIDFNPAMGPYIVDKDIVVPPGKTARIQAGCILMFQAFTGLKVEGSLQVEGADGRPVVFTSIQDTAFNPHAGQLPNPFDWNGVYITRGAGPCMLSNFRLSYSVYGIKSENPDVTVIADGVFRQNGQFHFTVNGNIQFVQEEIPYSYNLEKQPKVSKSEKSAKPSPAKSSESSGKDRRTRLVRFVGLGTGVVGAGLGTVFAVRAAQNQDRLAAIEADPSSYFPTDYDAARRAKRGGVAGATVGYTLAALGLVGFGISFTF